MLTRRPPVPGQCHTVASGSLMDPPANLEWRPGLNPTTTFWLGVLVSALVMLCGWYLTKRADDIRSGREGNFDRPELTVTMLGLPWTADRPLDCTYVMEETPGSTVMDTITIGVINKGRRAAEDLLLVATYPDRPLPEGGAYSVESTGLFPGRVVKHEKVGPLQQISMYVPHLTPQTGAVLGFAIPLDETRVSSTVEAPTSESDSPTVLTFQLEYALLLNVQVVSKERLWPGASARVSVTHGKSLSEAASAVRDRVRTEDRKSFRIGQGGKVMRAWAAFRYWRFRHRDRRRFYFMVPAFDSAATDRPWLTSDSAQAKYYVMFCTGSRWILIPNPTTRDNDLRTVEEIPLSPQV